MSVGGRARALFLIGFPGSEKSTWRAAALARAARPTAVVSTDDMIQAQARMMKSYEPHGPHEFDAVEFVAA